jgi:hypothetical protein
MAVWMKCSIDLFKWNTATHVLAAHFADLGLESMEDVPVEIVVIGKEREVSFVRHTNEYKPLHQRTYSPIGITIPYRRLLPTPLDFENIILVVRDW